MAASVLCVYALNITISKLTLSQELLYTGHSQGPLDDQHSSYLKRMWTVTGFQGRTPMHISSDG